jgi:hypothetical protein
VVGNFGDELLMQLEKLQGDLPLEETGTDSQDARNQRVIDDEEAEAPEVPEVSEETAVAIARKKKKPSKAKK